MKQNIIKLAFDAERLNRLDTAIQTAENELADLISLADDEIQGLLKMGDKTEPFCRKVIDVMAENPSVVPASFGLSEALADVAALDTLRPRLRRLQKLCSAPRTPRSHWEATSTPPRWRATPC